MRAIRFHEHGGPKVLRYDEVDDPLPSDGEVVIDVRACGLNRVDILSREGETPAPIPLPHTSGTEVAGVISAVGDGVDGWSEGDPVLVNPTISCGQCVACREGRDNMCRFGRIFGVQTLGGYAERVTAPAAHLVRIPEGMDFASAASVTVTGSTAYHMLVTRGGLSVGEDILIIAGGSGIGVIAIQIAKLAGARVIVTAGSQAKLDRAAELGADETVNHREAGWSRRIRELTGGRGVDMVFEHVGAATWEDSLASLARGGRLVTCGGHSGFEVTIDLWHLFVKEHTLIGSFAGTRRDLEHVLDLTARGSIQPVIHERFPLDGAADAQHLMEDRRIFGKVIIEP